MPTAPTKWQLHRTDRYEHFAAAWDRLNDSIGGLPFLSALFISGLLHTFGTGRERLCVLGPEGEERAFCIVTPQGRGVWQTWQPSQLPLGAWLMEPGLNYGDALACLRRALPGFPLLVAATQQDPAVCMRPADTATLRTINYIDTAWVDVRGSFDDYWKARGKNLQQNMHKQRSRLTRDGVQLSLEVVTSPDRVAEAVADYGRLESHGWKGAAGSAVSVDNTQGQFYRSVFEGFCRRGTGKIYRYRFGDRLVAIDLCVESADAHIVLKTTYDETIKGVSPSSLLRQDACRQIFAEGRVRRIEFFGRIMEWTKRWTENGRTLYHVNNYRWGFLPVAASRFAQIRAAQRPKEGKKKINDPGESQPLSS